MKKLILILAGALSGGVLSAQTETKVDFAKQIQPILEHSCVKCHGPEKQKGKLRLDSKEAALKGGKGGPAFKPGKADESEMYRRILLPATDDDRMPNEGDALTKAQTDLIRDWINQGAVWPEVAVAKDSPPKVKIGLDKLTAAPASPAEQKAIAKLESLGMAARPIAQKVDWREANLGLQGTNVTDATLAILKDIANLVQLNLRGTKITDAGLANLKGLSNLLELHLENTAVTDAGLANLKNLTNLTYLNVFGTAVTDAGLEHLKGLTDLRNLYLWQTKTTSNGVAALQKALPNLRIDTGWDLSSLPKPEEKKEEKKEEPKK
ncbi:MAG: hypothetical protein HY043_12695 [Verrucomicrobia bacterium]|nr:hypothetical protein [Verrucomicrobiota bacterium]